MIIIQTKLEYPGYIRRRDVEPELEEDGLRVYWSEGALTLTSYTILNEEDLTSILIGYYGDSTGQFWRHYKNGEPIKWKALPDSDRIRILKAEHPEWAREPGKLSYNYHKPNHHKKTEFDSAGAIIAYKYLVWVEREDVFRSLWTPMLLKTKEAARWIDNYLEADQIPTEENTNGIYCAKTFDSPLLDDYKKILDKNLRLVRLMLSGIVIEKDLGFRAERADILEVLNHEDRKEDDQDPQDTEAHPGR